MPIAKSPLAKTPLAKKPFTKQPLTKKLLTQMAHAINGRHSSTIGCQRWVLPVKNAILSGERRPAWC
jgi:hypothetical protein